MDKARTLPPLVRGKVTGVLNFFVDEIIIFRNCLLLTDNFDLVLQVQWWGESLPAFLRPKKLQVQDKICKNSHSLEFYYHLIKYEIKTTLDLFKIYLKSCERVEFCVLEPQQKYVIGSAFLRELPNLLDHNNEPIKMSIFNYLGIVIGEVTIHIEFIENIKHKYETSQTDIIITDNNSFLDKRLKKINGEKISEKIKSNYVTLNEKTLFYDIHPKINSQGKEFSTQLKSSADGHYLKKNKHIINSDVTQSISHTNNDLIMEQEINKNQKSEFDAKEFSYECLPKIKTSRDSSKVLYFGVSSQQPNSTTNIKNCSSKTVSKFNSNSIKCKSKLKSMKNSFPLDQNLCNKKPNFKKSDSSEVTKLKRKNQFDLSDSLFCNDLRPEMLLDCKQADLQSIASKESSNCKVLDYLLGSDMSKDDEEIALNNFKEMSPSHNLVSSISQLCLNSNGSYIKSPSFPLKPNHLHFDLSNPIERNYYEEFFLKSKRNSNFEVAEFLNLPENRVNLDKLKFSDTISQKNEPQNNNCKYTSEGLHGDEGSKETRIKNNHSINNICMNSKTSSCARCKYYKKLDELDTIIESLKHFEKKMLQHNKDLQLDFKLTPECVN